MLTDQQRVRSELLSMLGTPATDIDAARRDALRSAVRRWRSAIAPEHVGLPARRRRRSGLSGADVAELAGLSLCWYSQLESGSAKQHCSSRTLDRIANALQLADVDRAMLQILARPEVFRSLRVLVATPSPN
jgi:hypothetical protein